MEIYVSINIPNFQNLPFLDFAQTIAPEVQWEIVQMDIFIIIYVL